MGRRTKIIATIGPASDNPATLRAMVEAGMDVARLGLAHGTLEESVEKYHRVRAAAKEVGRHVGVLVDLPGPKVRIGATGDAGFDLVAGSTVSLRPGTEPSTATDVSVDYETFLADVRAGDRLAVGDGAVVLRVTDVSPDVAKAEVEYGGLVKGRPGLHIPSDRLTIPTPTPDDLVKLDRFVHLGVDMVAVSFVRSAHDVRRVGVEPHPRGPLVVAKIETRAAVENLPGIIEAAGAVMVARGDLGIECGIEELPHLQKHIIRDCVAFGLPVITATQMLESLVERSNPTRAEVSDVANAIFDGTSAVMLSGETAVGVDPVNAVATMARISERADAEFDYSSWPRNVRASRRHTPMANVSQQITDALTGATWRAATELGATAIIGITESGFTVRSIARFRPAMPILGFSPDPRTVEQLTLSWGVVPIRAPFLDDRRARTDQLVLAARDRGLVRAGDIVAVVAGAGHGSGKTDMMRLVRVP